MSVKLYKKAQRINVRNQRIEEMAQPEWGSESRLSMIQMLIPLGLQAVEEELQAEVRKLAGGGRHERTGTTVKRWGQNPGSVFVGDQKLRINVPRVRDMAAGQEIRLKSYERLQDPRHLDELALSRVINGISQGYFSGDPVSRSDAREVAEAWKPYCSVATWYIWRSLDPLPVAY